MTMRLRVVEKPENPWDAEAGDMWPCSWSKHEIAGRAPCWVIRLPETAWVFHTNEAATGTDRFWDVSGEPPLLTIRPSINVGPEIWHHTITNGESD